MDKLYYLLFNSKIFLMFEYFIFLSSCIAPESNNSPLPLLVNDTYYLVTYHYSSLFNGFRTSLAFEHIHSWNSFGPLSQCGCMNACVCTMSACLPQAINDHSMWLVIPLTGADHYFLQFANWNDFGKRTYTEVISSNT